MHNGLGEGSLGSVVEPRRVDLSILPRGIAMHVDQQPVVTSHQSGSERV